MRQPYLKPGDGPIVLVLAPTRELAVQIKEECDKFGASSTYLNDIVSGVSLILLIARLNVPTKSNVCRRRQEYSCVRWGEKKHTGS
jgi:superfamily II DNA/RNA helicase